MARAANSNFKQTTVQADSVVSRTVGKDDEEQDVLRVPVSSTRTDRDGDEFGKDCLEDMQDQIKEQQPLVFDDHGRAGPGMFGAGYSARETIGTQFDAELEQADDGEWDLYAFVNPDGTHEEGVRMLSQVRDEQQSIKFSVGFRILDYDPIEDDAGNEIGARYTRSDLLETSRVGIPANPDASLSVAAKGMQGMQGMQGSPAQLAHPGYAAFMGHQQAGFGDGIEAKSGGQPAGVSALKDSVEQLRSEVAELREAVKEDDDEDDDDDDDDGDDEEESSDGDDPEDDPDDDDEGDDDDDDKATDDDLRERLEDLEAEVGKGRGDPETGATSKTADADIPGESKDDDPDSEKDAGDDADETEQRSEPTTAFELAHE